MTAYRRETIVWGLLTLGAFACLPWVRVGKAFLAFSWPPDRSQARRPDPVALGRVGLAAVLAVLRRRRGQEATGAAGESSSPSPALGVLARGCTS